MKMIEILLIHNIVVLKTIDDNTFEVLEVYTKDGIAYAEQIKIHFTSKKELFGWLGY